MIGSTPTRIHEEFKVIEQKDEDIGETVGRGGIQVELDIHQHTIDYLRSLDRSEVMKRNIKALLSGIKENKLTVEDVLSFTTIPATVLNELLEVDEDLIMWSIGG